MTQGTWRWYTKGRRVPTLIGKDSSGRQIPGGPYTGLQVVAAPLTAALMWQTRWLWAATLPGLAALIVIAAVTIGAVKLLGKVDFASRNPLYLAAGYLRQATQPSGGRWADSPMRNQPHQRITRTAIALAHPIATGATGEASADLHRATERAGQAATSPIRPDRSRDSRSTTRRELMPAPDTTVSQAEPSTPRTNPTTNRAQAQRTAAQTPLSPAPAAGPENGEAVPARRSGLQAFLSARATDQVAADQVTADQVTADQVTAAQVTADQVTPSRATNRRPTRRAA